MNSVLILYLVCYAFQWCISFQPIVYKKRDKRYVLIFDIFFANIHHALKFTIKKEIK